MEAVPAQAGSATQNLVSPCSVLKCSLTFRDTMESFGEVADRNVEKRQRIFFVNLNGISGGCADFPCQPLRSSYLEAKWERRA
jgi:hypothetical protein